MVLLLLMTLLATAVVTSRGQGFVDQSSGLAAPESNLRSSVVRVSSSLSSTLTVWMYPNPSNLQICPGQTLVLTTCNFNKVVKGNSITTFNLWARGIDLQYQLAGRWVNFVSVVNVPRFNVAFRDAFTYGEPFFQSPTRDLGGNYLCQLDITTNNIPRTYLRAFTLTLSPVCA